MSIISFYNILKTDFDKLLSNNMQELKKECKNCNTHFEGNYCFNCGQEADEKRFTIKNLPGEFLHGFFHVHGGLIFTIKELFMRPGEMLRGYIHGKRVDYFNPFTYLVLISLLGGFMFTYSGFGENIRDNILATGETINFTRKHFSYRMLLMVPSYAFMCWILFRSAKYNLAEHLIINTFLISQTIVFSLVWLVVFSILKPKNMNFIIIYISTFLTIILYQVIVLFALFNKGNSAMRLLKSIIAVLAGLGLSFVVMNTLANFLQ